MEANDMWHGNKTSLEACCCLLLIIDTLQSYLE